jgi:excisionase family DNA binding protein
MKTGRWGSGGAAIGRTDAHGTAQAGPRGTRGADKIATTERRDVPNLLTVREVADLLRTTRKAIYAMVDRRQLPGVVRIGRRVLIDASDVVLWLRQKRAPSPEE